MVFICICTYKRIEKLTNLLQKLSQMYNDRPYNVLVVDNDEAGSAKPIEERFNVHYLIEKEPGISSARNTAVVTAISLGAKYIAFLDDDEIPSDGWLESLFSVMNKFNADIVAGPVQPVLNQESEKFRKFIGRKDLATGTSIITFGAGNAIFDVSVFSQIGLFDERYSFSGGEDTHFAYRCHRGGIKAVWCSEALVYEPTGIDRANPKWILARAYRTGKIISRVEMDVKPTAVPRRILVALAKILFAMTKLPFFYLKVDNESGERLSVQRDIYSACGMLMGILGYHHKGSRYGG